LAQRSDKAKALPSISPGKSEFVPLLNKAGGAGFQVTVYTQTWSDVEAKIGNKAKADQIGGNLNTLIMLRVKNAETAEILTNQLPMVEVLTTTMVSGAGDTNDPGEFADFTAKTEDRITAREVAMIQPADLVQLPKGQAFALIEGGRLYKLRLPLPGQSADDEHWPANLEVVFAGMHAKYARQEPQWLEDGFEVPQAFDGTPQDRLTTKGGHRGG
jgi:TraM recognition site of TraD and TraG